MQCEILYNASFLEKIEVFNASYIITYHNTIIIKNSVMTCSKRFLMEVPTESTRLSHQQPAKITHIMNSTPV